MSELEEVVVTGMGVVCPIGIGPAAYWASLVEGRSGIRRQPLYAPEDDLPVPFSGDVADFDPRQHVRPRKSLKVMNRDIQLAFAAADMACADAGFQRARPEPERLGVLFGADLPTCEIAEIEPAYRACMVDGRFDFARWGSAVARELYPLWMLKYLPNMPACQVAIAQEAHGPNNTITLAEASSLAALAEAVRVLQRGQADAMIVGGTGAVHPAMWTRFGGFPFSRHWDDPAAACRPFDRRRDGLVWGEGAAAFILETRRSAEARHATLHGRILGFASRFESRGRGQPLKGRAIRQSIAAALAHSGLKPGEIGHVNAHGLSTRDDDRIEAQAIRVTLGDVPVTAPKSFFGNASAGAGAVEMVASLLALQQGQVPFTLNYECPDPECPIDVVCGSMRTSRAPTAMLLNHCQHGRAVALVLGGP